MWCCDVACIVCGVCACGLNVMCLSVVIVMYCVLVHGLCLCVLCVLCVCVAVPFNAIVCGVGGLVFGVVWFAVVCDVLCLCAVFV